MDKQSKDEETEYLLRHYYMRDYGRFMSCIRPDSRFMDIHDYLLGLIARKFPQIKFGRDIVDICDFVMYMKELYANIMTLTAGSYDHFTFYENVWINPNLSDSLYKKIIKNFAHKNHDLCNIRWDDFVTYNQLVRFQKMTSHRKQLYEDVSLEKLIELRENGRLRNGNYEQNPNLTIEFINDERLNYSCDLCQLTRNLIFNESNIYDFCKKMPYYSPSSASYFTITYLLNPHCTLNFVKQHVNESLSLKFLKDCCNYLIKNLFNWHPVILEQNLEKDRAANKLRVQTVLQSTFSNVFMDIVVKYVDYV